MASYEYFIYLIIYNYLFLFIYLFTFFLDILDTSAVETAQAQDSTTINTSKDPTTTTKEVTIQFNLVSKVFILYGFLSILIDVFCVLFRF